MNFVQPFAGKRKNLAWTETAMSPSRLGISGSAKTSKNGVPVACQPTHLPRSAGMQCSAIRQRKRSDLLFWVTRRDRMARRHSFTSEDCSEHIDSDKHYWREGRQ